MPTRSARSPGWRTARRVARPVRATPRAGGRSRRSSGRRSALPSIPATPATGTTASSREAVRSDTRSGRVTTVEEPRRPSGVEARGSLRHRHLATLSAGPSGSWPSALLAVQARLSGPMSFVAYQVGGRDGVWLRAPCGGQVRWATSRQPAGEVTSTSTPGRSRRANAKGGELVGDRSREVDAPPPAPAAVHQDGGPPAGGN